MSSQKDVDYGSGAGDRHRLLATVRVAGGQPREPRLSTGKRQARAVSENEKEGLQEGRQAQKGSKSGQQGRQLRHLQVPQEGQVRGCAEQIAARYPRSADSRIAHDCGRGAAAPVAGTATASRLSQRACSRWSR